MPHQEGAGLEHPKTHNIIIGSIIVFLIVWILDSFIFALTTQLVAFVPLYIRIILLITCIIIGYIFSHLSEKAVFPEPQENPKLAKTGIFAYVRNPMYLSIPIWFIGMMIITMSLISIVPIIASFFFYDIFVKFEEAELEKVFGQEYLDYKKKVPRWRPRLTPAKFR